MPCYMIHRRRWLSSHSAHYTGLSLRHQALLPIDSADIVPLGLNPPTDSIASKTGHTHTHILMLDFAEEVSH